MKLKEKSVRDFLVTQSGFTITKEYSEVDDNDKEVQSFIINRNDIFIKNVEEKIIDSGSEIKKPKEEVFKEVKPETPKKKESKKVNNFDSKKVESKKNDKKN